MDYIEQVSAGMFDHASDSIDKAEEEHGEVNTALPIETDEKEVEAGESTQDFADQGLQSPTVDEKEKDRVDENPDAQYTRSTAFNTATGNVELEVPENFDKAETTKERLAELRSVNEELERQGDKRRYVASKSDAPDSAQLYKDDFGTYYYKQIEVDVRPSDVAKFADVKAVAALDDDQKALKTIEMMSSMYADPLIDASTEKAAETWLDRHLVLTDDDPGSNDTFSHEFKSRIASLIARAGSPDGEQEDRNMRTKQWRYVEDPSDAPDDVSVEEGPQGGYRYQAPDTEEEESGDDEDLGGGGGPPENVGPADDPLDDFEVQEDAMRMVGDLESEYDLDDEEQYEQAWQEVEEEAQRLAEFPEYGQEQVDSFLDYAMAEMTGQY